MGYYRLRADRNSVFTRHARNEKGDRVKALRFEPGVITCVLDEDVEAIRDDIGEGCLTEVTDEQEIARRGFAFANYDDVPANAPADDGAAAPSAEATDETSAPDKKKNGGKKNGGKKNGGKKNGGKKSDDDAAPTTDAPQAETSTPE
jgi:hypothetical protein